jgi:hypothetical protein
LTTACREGKKIFLTVLTKLTIFGETLTLWGARIKKENTVEMFELIKSCTLNKNLVDLLLQSLPLLSKNTEMYFPSLNVSSLDWEPFVLNAFESAKLNVAEKDELTEIRDDRRLKLEHSSTDMALLWLSLRQEYPIITEKEIKALRPFSTWYLCEAGFSAMNTMKRKNKSRLQTPEEALRVCL